MRRHVDIVLATHSPHATPRLGDATVLDWPALHNGTEADAWAMLSSIRLTGNCYRLPGENFVRRLNEVTSQRILTARRVPLMSAGSPRSRALPHILLYTGATHALNTLRTVPLMPRFSAV